MNRIRLFENFHILLWLMKDMCWVLQFKLAGTLLVFPTLGLAIYMAWQTSGSRVFFLPNVSVCFWLSANITWMLGEFYDFPHKLPAFAFFGLGIGIIIWYFLVHFIERNKAREA